MCSQAQQGGETFVADTSSGLGNLLGDHIHKTPIHAYDREIIGMNRRFVHMNAK